MKTLPIHQVDAFTSVPFRGNPAAVCPLEEWLPDALLQDIAAENNLSETAFTVAREDGSYDLRWFTPTVEVNLCGHATLATAHILMQGDLITFHSKSGPLHVRREDGRLVLDFPALPAGDPVSDEEVVNRLIVRRSKTAPGADVPEISYKDLT